MRTTLPADLSLQRIAARVFAAFIVAFSLLAVLAFPGYASGVVPFGYRPLIQQSPVLTITLSADRPVIEAGDTMGFTITVVNRGTADASTLTITDKLPSGSLIWSVSPAVTGCSIRSGTLTCRTSSLAVGAAFSVHIKSTKTPSVCAIHNNTATVQASNHPLVSSSATTEVLCPDVGVLKEPLKNPIETGDPAGFTMTVTNTGSGVAKSVRLLDPLPTYIFWKTSDSRCQIILFEMVCNLGNLPAGASTTVVVNATTPQNICGWLVNTAYVSASNEPSSVRGNNNSSSEITVNCSALELTNTADAESVAAGEAIGFTMEVRNTGPGKSVSVLLTDTLPVGPGLKWSVNPSVAGCSISNGNLRCSFGDMPVGASAVVHITSPTTLESCGTYTNTAQASSNNTEEDPTTSAAVSVLCPEAPVP